MGPTQEAPARLRAPEPERARSRLARPADSLRRSRGGALPSTGLALCAALAAALGAAAASAAQPAAGATLIRGALLIDGSNRGPYPRTDILIRNGRIEQVRAGGGLESPLDATVIDATGKTVIPGIINLRGLAGLIRSPAIELESFSEEAIAISLERYAAYGVTTVATPAPKADRIRAFRGAARRGGLHGTARVLTPLRRLQPQSAFTEGPPRADGMVDVVRSGAVARDLVRRLAGDGADFIELRDSRTQEGSAGEGDPAAQVIRQAGLLDLRTIAAAARATVAAALVRHGAIALASSVSDAVVDDEFAAALAAADATYAPALLEQLLRFGFGDVPEWLNDRYLRRTMPSGVAGQLRGPMLIRQALDPDRSLHRRRFATACRNLRKLASAGVRIAFASGSGVAGTFEGYSEYQEAVLMVRAGLSPAAVIRAFSSGSATALGITAERGTVAPGRLADLVILNANPLENIHNLRELHAVMVGGRLVRL